MSKQKHRMSILLISVWAVTTGPMLAVAETPNAAAWRAWEQGNIEEAARLAATSEQDDDARHLLLLAAFMRGEYESMLRQYPHIGAEYTRRSELHGPVLDAYLHLGRYSEAEQFARAQRMSAHRIASVAARKAQPLRVELDALTVVPYADHPLAAYFPAFPAEVNGTKQTVHVDTGGTFLIMGPGAAQSLKIDVVESGKGFHGSREVNLSRGMAREFRLGAARLENVPVTVMPTLTGPQNFVIFGTNVLQQFLSTLDYTNRRLVLSPRGQADQRKRHLAMLPAQRVRVPFYMWGDHYMFARGAMGEHEGLNFFIDSGLVSLHPDENGKLQQAAFTTSNENFRAWGFGDEPLSQKVFQSDKSLALGALSQTGLLMLPDGKVGTGSFSGVRMHGLLSHAFLNQYAWTLDFETRTYTFGTESK